MVFVSGLHNVTLSRCKNVLTGYTWKYSYYDKSVDKLRAFTSIDLKLLRRKVEDNGLEWVVTDLNKAKESYDLNKKLLNKHKLLKQETKQRGNSSGVKYVCKTKEKYSLLGYYWRYYDYKKKKSYSRKTLLELKDFVTSKGYDWIVINEEQYNKFVEEENKAYSSP